MSETGERETERERERERGREGEIEREGERKRTTWPFTSYMSSPVMSRSLI